MGIVLINMTMYNKILNIILSWIFPGLKKIKDAKRLQVVKQYFLLVIDIPYDRYRIEFCDENEVQIYLIYNTWVDAYNNVKKIDKLREDMSGMFPYMFRVSCTVII